MCRHRKCLAAEAPMHRAPGKPASKAQFPGPPSPLLFLWTQLSEKSTWNIVQHVFPWTRIECRKETICILEILFCRKSMCQENGTYVLNEFKQSCTFAMLFKKNHIYYISLRLTWVFHQHLIKIEIRTPSTRWQYSIHGSPYRTRFWKMTLLKPNIHPQVHNRPLSEYPNKSWQNRRQYVATG